MFYSVSEFQHASCKYVSVWSYGSDLDRIVLQELACWLSLIDQYPGSRLSGRITMQLGKTKRPSRQRTLKLDNAACVPMTMALISNKDITTIVTMKRTNDQPMVSRVVELRYLSASATSDRFLPLHHIILAQQYI